eukprot:16799_1
MGGQQKTYQMGGQQMYEMRGIGQTGQPNQHRMGGQQMYHNGSDNGGGGANIGGSQMDGLYGSLGTLGSGNGQGGWTYGKPLQVQLVSEQYNGDGGMGMGS